MHTHFLRIRIVKYTKSQRESQIRACLVHTNFMDYDEGSGCMLNLFEGLLSALQHYIRNVLFLTRIQSWFAILMQHFNTYFGIYI